MMDLGNPNSISVSHTQLQAGNGKAALIHTAAETFRAHWPEYLIEAACLGFFMISACGFTAFLYHPSSPVAKDIHSELLRRALMGTAMGATAIAIIFSPFGKRSGAHINPAVTITYLRLGKVKPFDAAFYTLFQFVGGILGVLIAVVLMGPYVAHQSVNYAVTVPGPTGWLRAFVAEIAISFLLMSVVLTMSNSGLGRWTGLFAGFLIANFITFESPISGMSMNPARTLGSASGAHVWTGLWIYFTAPLFGMLLAAEVYKRLFAGRGVECAKLHHQNKQRCIFCGARKR